MNKDFIYILSFMLLSVLFSCSTFEYSDENQIELTAVTVNVDGEGYKVMAGRQVKSVHYVWDVDSVSQMVKVGNYYATAFLAEGSLYRLDGLKEFQEDSTVSMQDVYASLPELSLEDRQEMVDCNPYAPYIEHADSLLMCASQRFTAQGSAMTLNFSPVSLTQQIKFRLHIRVDEGVEIKSVNAILSGVAGRVKLMTGLVRNDIDNPTYKLYMNMQMVSEDDVRIYESTANVLGLFPSDSDMYRVGPGILHLEVSAFVEEDGEIRERVSYAGINLKSLIEGAGLMTEMEDKSGYRLSRTEALIDVPVVLEVRRDKVVSASGDGFTQWFVQDEEIDVDV